MNFKKTLSAVALGVAAMAAHAVPTITNADGTFTFGGIDWHSNGTAFTTDFQAVPNDTFTLKYYAWAGAILDANGDSLDLDGLDTTANGIKNKTYEYTIVATLTESTGPACAPGSFCSFQLLSGTFDIYYDLAANAKNSDGTGFGNGTATKIMSGAFVPGFSGNFTGTAPHNGSGSSTLDAVVTYVDTTYIQGLGIGTKTTLGGSIQQGDRDTRTGTNKPTAYEGIAFQTTGPNPANELFQADQNQNFVFSAVPEPSSLALVGLALAAGAGVTSRRRLKK